MAAGASALSLIKLMKFSIRKRMAYKWTNQSKVCLILEFSKLVNTNLSANVKIFLVLKAFLNPSMGGSLMNVVYQSNEGTPVKSVISAIVSTPLNSDKL